VNTPFSRVTSNDGAHVQPEDLGTDGCGVCTQTLKLGSYPLCSQAHQVITAILRLKLPLSGKGASHFLLEHQDVSAYELRIADEDGGPDLDFPELDKTVPIASFGVSHFVLCAIGQSNTLVHIRLLGSSSSSSDLGGGGGDGIASHNMYSNGNPSQAGQALEIEYLSNADIEDDTDDVPSENLDGPQRRIKLNLVCGPSFTEANLGAGEKQGGEYQPQKMQMWVSTPSMESKTGSVSNTGQSQTPPILASNEVAAVVSETQLDSYFPQSCAAASSSAGMFTTRPIVGNQSGESEESYSKYRFPVRNLDTGEEFTFSELEMETQTTNFFLPT